jgi:hypothetical protein
LPARAWAAPVRIIPARVRIDIITCAIRNLLLI